MKPKFVLILVLTIGMVITTKAFAETNHRLGVGAQYWKVVNSIDVEHINKEGFSGIVSYQLIPTSMLKFELDLEVAPDGIIIPDKTAYAPQAYIIVGKGIYAALGIGIWYANDKFMDEPFYALRAGVDLEVLPSVYLDVNANYRFARWDYETIKGDISGDTITLGTMLRIEF
ncbi:MAG: hypothetical protein AB1547_07325 [Thermodesulfobacteriota bacterium]